jgi:cold shock CspA family protein
MRGQVKSWAATFGFIGNLAGAPHELELVPPGRDVFVHFSDLPEMSGPRNLRPGQWVEFEVESTEKGAKARNVRLTD